MPVGIPKEGVPNAPVQLGGGGRDQKKLDGGKAGIRPARKLKNAKVRVI